MAHIQACTVCGKKVACLACSRKAPRKRPTVARPTTLARASVCDLCGFGGKACDCGGGEDEFLEEDQDEFGGDGDFDEEEYDDEPNGFGGGAVVDLFDALAQAFLSDDDEDPLGDKDDLEEDESIWTPKKTTMRRPQQSQGFTYAAVPTTKRVAATKKTSGFAASRTERMNDYSQKYRQIYQPQSQTENISETIGRIASGVSSGMLFSDWVRSIGTLTQRWDNVTNYMPVRPAVINGQVIRNTWHGGTDIAKLPIGAPITAFRGGQVVEIAGSSASTKGWGLTVVLKDREGNSHRYAHLNDLALYQGQDVKTGDYIGAMGRSGTVFGKTGIHLHYEVKDKFGNLIDPSSL